MHNINILLIYRRYKLYVRLIIKGDISSGTEVILTSKIKLLSGTVHRIMMIEI